MHLNPNTKLASLLAAIPSAATVCESFHIPVAGNENKSLERLCTEAGITVANFLQALEDLDWDKEYPISVN